MKKLITIFSVILTMGALTPNNCFSAKLCQKASCNFRAVGAEKVTVDGVIDSNITSGDCFSCDEGKIGGDKECDYKDVIITNNGGHAFICIDEAGTSDDPWTEIYASSSNVEACSTSLLDIEARGGSNVKASFRSKEKASIPIIAAEHIGNASSQTVASGASVVCLYLECETNFAPASDRKSCIDLSSACTDSHGDWNSNKCDCDSSLGLENSDRSNPASPCKCSDPTYSWNGTKCIAADAADVAACTDSGGDWSGGRCVCDSSKGLAGPNTDGACSCADATKIYDPAQRKCTDTSENVCKNTGGNWNPTTGACDCDISAKNIKRGSNPVRCECESPDYDWKNGHDSPSADGCVLTDDAKNRRDLFVATKRACENWGGHWLPLTWEWENPDARDSMRWKCTCPSGAGVVQAGNLSCQCDSANGYLLKSNVPPYQCELADCAKLKADCPSAVATYYDLGTAHGRNICSCQCNDANKEYIASSKSCVDRQNPEAEICKHIKGAVVGKSGKCVCLETLLPPVGGKCVTAGGATSGTGTMGTSGNVDEIKRQITSAHQSLTEISRDFDRSHWKTASGNFNGARLASDSVAGVVLGTVGGVVTSNIIKKNQVKGGFEKLQCTVGGQLVADYGDQFQVGIR